MILRELLVVIGEDRELVEMLLDAGVFPPPLERDYSDSEAETARVARTLLRDLEVNLAGVEVILRMREEMLAMRAQVRELLTKVTESRS
jgi:hypothetical protein